jgi:hypothetical protein
MCFGHVSNSEAVMTLWLVVPLKGNVLLKMTSSVNYDAHRKVWQRINGGAVHARYGDSIPIDGYVPDNTYGRTFDRAR